MYQRDLFLRDEMEVRAERQRVAQILQREDEQAAREEVRVVCCF